MLEFIGKRRRLSLFALLLLLLGGMILCGCGGDSTDSGASELARQRELAEARTQAAQDARQSAHIEDLERRLRSISRKNEGRGQADATATAPSTSTGTGDQEHSAGPDDWPGGSGFTAVLASLSSEADANSIQAEATARGLDAGVLYSSNFSSLRPGYWVVFSGVFPDASGAATRTTRAHELGYADAYPRFVSP